jgi:hypothetical protein
MAKKRKVSTTYAHKIEKAPVLVRGPTVDIQSPDDSLTAQKPPFKVTVNASASGGGTLSVGLLSSTGSGIFSTPPNVAVDTSATNYDFQFQTVSDGTYTLGAMVHSGIDSVSESIPIVVKN